MIALPYCVLPNVRNNLPAHTFCSSPHQVAMRDYIINLNFNASVIYHLLKQKYIPSHSFTSSSTSFAFPSYVFADKFCITTIVPHTFTITMADGVGRYSNDNKRNALKKNYKNILIGRPKKKISLICNCLVRLLPFCQRKKK